MPSLPGNPPQLLFVIYLLLFLPVKNNVYTKLYNLDDNKFTVFIYIKFKF